MKKLIILSIFLTIFSGCQNENHHMSINDPVGIDTVYESGKLKIKGQNSPFVVFFFSATCGACSEQVPSLIELGKKFKNVKFIGIMGNSQGFDKDMKILKEKGVDFLTISSPKSVDYFSNAVGGIYGVPATFLFDKDGKIVKKYIGLTSKKYHRKRYKKPTLKIFIIFNKNLNF